MVRFPDSGRQLRGRGLAYFYGIPTDPGVGTFQRVEYSGDNRAGFFGLAGFLAVTSLDRRTVALATRTLDREQPSV